MKDALLTFVQGDSFLDNLDCEVFLHSIKKYKTFDKVCFIKNISLEKQEWLKKYFDFVVEPNHAINVPNCDRFICYYEFLCEHPEYEYILHLDFRDMILQGDPFPYMKSFPEKDLFFALEGMKIKDSPFNEMWANWKNNLIPTHKLDYKNDMVINAGNIGGKYSSFLSLCLMIFLDTNRIAPHVVFEQPVLNYLYRYLLENPKVKICHPHESEFCVIGEGIKYGFVKTIFSNGKICKEDGTPYLIYHQWDRNSHADFLRDKLKNKFII